MSRVALSSVAEFSRTAAPSASGAGPVALRQLRHLTKNTLQQLIGQIENTPGLQERPGMAQDLIRRIKASAAISDCLFGLTASPPPLQERLGGLCDGLLRLFAAEDLAIRTELTVQGDCPTELEEAVIGIAHEFVGNALRHGMYARAAGRITVRLVSAAGRTTLSVRDDGWGLPDAPGARAGEGLALAREMAARHGGSVSLCRETVREGGRGGTTEARAVLLHRALG